MVEIDSFLQHLDKETEDQDAGYSIVLNSSHSTGFLKGKGILKENESILNLLNKERRQQVEQEYEKSFSFEVEENTLRPEEEDIKVKLSLEQAKNALLHETGETATENSASVLLQQIAGDAAAVRNGLQVLELIFSNPTAMQDINYQVRARNRLESIVTLLPLLMKVEKLLSTTEVASEDRRARVHELRQRIVDLKPDVQALLKNKSYREKISFLFSNNTTA